MTNRIFTVRSIQMAENVDVVDLMDGNSRITVQDVHMGDPDRTLVFTPGQFVRVTIDTGTAIGDEQ